MLATTSNLNTFGFVATADLLFREAFERIGMNGKTLTNELLRSAELSANLALTEWMGKIPLTFLRKRCFFNLTPGTYSYLLPSTLTHVVDAVLTTPTSLVGIGTAISSNIINGAPNNVFVETMANGQPNLGGCTVNGAPAYIGYVFPSPVSVAYIGIVPLTPQTTYSFTVQTCQNPNGVNPNWITVATFTWDVYNWSPVTWLVVKNSPLALGWRIVSNPNTQSTVANTLSLAQLLFYGINSSSVSDRQLGEISYSEWMSIPNKSVMGTPSAYAIDYQLNPIMNIWQTPTSLSNGFGVVYTAWFYPQTVTALFQNFDIPQRFFEALVAELGYRLAAKWKLDNEALIQRLKSESLAAFDIAAKTDNTTSLLTIQPNFASFNR